MKFTCQQNLLILMTTIGVTEYVSARTVAGPFVKLEKSGPSDTIPREGQSPGTRVERTNVLAVLVAPVVLSQSFGSMIFRAEAFKETRQYQDAPLQSLNVDDPSHVAFGLLYLPPVPESWPKPFVLGARYSGFDLYKTSPMAEYMAGLAWGELPFLSRLSIVSAEGRALFRHRAFPFATRQILIIEQNLLHSSGLHLGLGMPTFLQIGWQNSPKTRSFFVGQRFEQRQYPAKNIDSGAWVDGKTVNQYLGYQQKVFSVFYAEVQLGYQQEKLATFSEDNRIVQRYETKSAPWGMLGIKTEFEVAKNKS